LFHLILLGLQSLAMSFVCLMAVNEVSFDVD